MSARDAAERLLAELLQAGAIPRIEAERLRIDAPPGILTPERRERLAGCLPELRAILLQGGLHRLSSSKQSTPMLPPLARAPPEAASAS